MKRAGLFLLLVGIGVIQACAKRRPPQEVLLQLSLANNQGEFHIGETIPLRLSFSTHAKDHYQLNEAHYDRSGRMNYERFIVSPAEGAVDPLANDGVRMGGGLTNYSFLTPKPWTIQLNLNEWVRFTKPGEYKLTVSSERVEVQDRSQPSGTSPATATSNEITLKIVAPGPAWQKQVYTDAVAILDARSPAKPQDEEESKASRERALETLRFLGTAEATRELAKRMRGEGRGRLDFICLLGLISSAERAVARNALDEALADPAHPIDDTFLEAMRMVNADAATPYVDRPEGRQQVMEKLLRALPNKRGQALSISLSSAVKEAWDQNKLPQQTVDKLVSQLVSIFDDLPADEQNNLLTYRWDKIASPALLPILQRYAQLPSGSRQLTSSALKRWFELDPAGARPIVIQEITRPRPRFGAAELGLLPDETLPEVDQVLADHFAASDDYNVSWNLASLIARYATAAILPQIVEKLDANVGTWACVVQEAILAFVLRVNPQLARPRIEKAIAARGKEFTACNRRLLTAVSGIRYDPILEEVALYSLDDSDPEVAQDAAMLLGRFGSREAEPALWRRYESWSKRWKGHESELDVTFLEPPGDRLRQLELGQHLSKALATGRNWLTDQPKLQRLAGANRIHLIQEELNRYLRSWDEHPLAISIDLRTTSFYARLAQYQLDSMEDLKEKLSQFPSGTRFALSLLSDNSTADDQCIAEMRAFLTGHGMSLAEKP